MIKQRFCSFNMASIVSQTKPKSVLRKRPTSPNHTNNLETFPLRTPYPGVSIQCLKLVTSLSQRNISKLVAVEPRLSGLRLSGLFTEVPTSPDNRGLTVLRLLISVKLSRQFFNQWETKSKPIAPWTRALSKLLLISKNSHWFLHCAVCSCCDWSE